MSDRPSRSELDRVTGYVRAIQVEQMDDRDQIWCTMDITEDTAGLPTGSVNDFAIYLDVGTTVALAQLHLLRAGMANEWVVSLAYDSGGLPRVVYSVEVER